MKMQTAEETTMNRVKILFSVGRDMVGIEMSTFVRGGVLHVFLLPVLDVANHHQRGAGDEDELQGPQADVGDGEDVVVAHVGAAWLLGVADKVFVLISPHPLSRHHKHHHPEDENHGEPHSAENGGVLVDPTEECLQSTPVHDGCLKREDVSEGARLIGVALLYIASPTMEAPWNGCNVWRCLTVAPTRAGAGVRWGAYWGPWGGYRDRLPRRRSEFAALCWPEAKHFPVHVCINRVSGSHAHAVKQLLSATHATQTKLMPNKMRALSILLNCFTWDCKISRVHPSLSCPSVLPAVWTIMRVDVMIFPVARYFKKELAGCDVYV
ncbi:unnamed protein product [Menidia menidia]|uniref:(Atlantic silverside) hypothetical protein n=1 Tax=Menidia menidia TaxID=238744 RepID=A0A8S4AL17_9TELE|nr:unnamed protein product [Menidia menidia]